tara:strand:- start:956 stop:2845 length:1890 start_codon:yes stop_codon:yes gene_type:complete
LPTIDVPGIGSVFADGFAEESTMQRILAAIQGQENGGGATVTTQRTQSAITQLGSTVQKTGASVQDGGQRATSGLMMVGPAAQRLSSNLTASSRSLSQSFESAAQAPFAFANTVVQMGAKIAGDSKLLTTAIGAVGGVAMADLFGQDGPIAKTVAAALGGTAGALFGDATTTALAGIAGFLFEKLNATTDAFFKVQSTGAILGGSLIQLRTNAHASNLTMAEFTNVMAKNSEQMASFGGQTIKGAREFARANQRLTQLHGQELLQLGVSFEDMGMATSDMMQQFARSGHSIETAGINTREFAQATRNQITQQKIVAALTGRSIEQQKQAERAQRKDAVVQASLQRMAPEQRAEMERLISAFPHLKDAILDQAVFGAATSAEALRQVSVFPTAMNGIAGAVDDITNGIGGAGDAFIKSAEFSDEIKAETFAAGDMIATLGRFTSNALIKTATDSFIPMQELMMASINKTVLSVADDMAKVGSASNAATVEITKMIEANRAVGMSLSNLTTGVLSNSDGIVSVLSSAMNGIADTANNFALRMGLPTGTTAGPFNSEVGISGLNELGDGDGGQSSTASGSANANTANPLGTGTVHVTDPAANAILSDMYDEIKKQGKDSKRTQDMMNLAAGG